MSNSFEVFSDMNNESTKEISESKNIFNIYTLLEISIACAATFGNLLVIIVFCIEKKLRRRAYYFIISLSIADFLVGVLAIPLAILASLCNTRRRKNS